MHGTGRALAASTELKATALAADLVEPDDSDGVDDAIRLDSLYREESPRLIRSIAAKTSSREDARELVHEIFCRLVRVRDRAAQLERPRAYLSRMATNLLRDRAKSASRKMQRNQVPVDEANLTATDQVRLLETRDMLRRVEAAMLMLRPKTREIFMAHRIDGLTYGEIAERFGLSVKGVEKQMSKAIAKLDRLLDRD